MNDQITISVVCPSYNSAGFIKATLESVARQTRKPDEIIISDDGSMDHTAQIVREFMQQHPYLNIYLLTNPHQGPGAARNHGIKKSTGQWVALLDSDDLWYPEKLQIVETYIKNNPKCNLFCHSEIRKNPDGSIQPLEYYKDFNPHKSLIRQLYWKNFLSPSTTVCRRELFEQAGYFHEHLSSAQDYELWLRMTPRMKPYLMKEVLGNYCYRIGNISSGSLKRRFRDMMRVLSLHREKVGWFLYLQRVGWVCLSFLKAYLNRLKDK